MNLSHVKISQKPVSIERRLKYWNIEYTFKGPTLFLYIFRSYSNSQILLKLIHDGLKTWDVEFIKVSNKTFVFGVWEVRFRIVRERK